MASQGLTREQCLLLQRFHDGELSAAQSVQAEQLVERSASARVFVRALEELSGAVRAADEAAWDRAKAEITSPQVLVELAQSAGDLSEVALADLAPLLERFHDGEADEAEMAFVAALLEERDDAVDYLASLDEIGQGMRVVGAEMAEEVDFGGFWEAVSAGIDAQAATTPAESFDREQHLVLLHRYVDGEVSAQERALVDGWLAVDDHEVHAYIDALGELTLGVNVALETACEQVDLHDIWTGVSGRLDDDSGSAEVVSLSEAAHKRRGGGGGAGAPGWFKEYRQAIVGALAAAVVLAGLVGLFKDRILGPPGEGRRPKARGDRREG